MHGHEDDINVLRTAAQQREWTTLQDTLKRLLARLEPIPALEIAALRIYDHLPRFESYYPQATWVRELFMTVMAYASAPNDLPDHALTQFPQPGCGNFLSAVLDVARGVQTKYTVFERYSFMTNAVANVTLADLMDFYYRQHPQEWDQLTEHADEVDAQSGLTVRQQAYMRFWMDEAVAQRDTATWLKIADMLEEKLAKA